MLRSLLRRLASAVARATGVEEMNFSDLSDLERAILAKVQPYTMTSTARLVATMSAVSHVARHAIPGAIVECGVWRGGNMMAAALLLARMQRADRELYLFDTFEGMTEPAEIDVSSHGDSARTIFDRLRGSGRDSSWCAAAFDEVRANLDSTGYPQPLMHLVKGPVEETIPGNAPATIAVLRLDTDWHSSTLHELRHLYPRLSPGGILIIDDYGHWAGARKAVDEYFSQAGIAAFLHRSDYTGRTFQKPWAAPSPS